MFSTKILAFDELVISVRSSDDIVQSIQSPVLWQSSLSSDIILQKTREMGFAWNQKCNSQSIAIIVFIEYV